MTEQPKRREIFRNDKLHVVEEAPRCRVVKFVLGALHAKYYLSFPYVQLGRYQHNNHVSLHASFSNQPLKSIEDKVYLPCLPNCWSPSLQVCVYPSNSDFEHLIELFWSAWFTPTEKYDGWRAIEKTPMWGGLDSGTNMPSFKKWGEMTQQDPTFITKVDWPIEASWTSVNDKMHLRGFAVYPRY